MSSLRIAANRRSSQSRSFRTWSIVSRLAPRPTPRSPCSAGTLNCMRMLWNNASASSKTRARRSAATGCVTARSRIASAWSIATSEPVARACAADRAPAPPGRSRRSGGCAHRRRNRRGRAPAGTASWPAPAATRRSSARNCWSVVSTEPLDSSGPRQFCSRAKRPWAKPSASRVVQADQATAVVAQDVEHVGVRVPAQRAPDELVDVVVAAFRIGDEADRLVGERVEDRRLVTRARVDHLAALRSAHRRRPSRGPDTGTAGCA